MIFKELTAIFIFLVVAVGVFLFLSKPKVITGVSLAGKLFSVEVVSTNSGLEKGLSGHPELSDNQGMLFVFSKPDLYGFWMKDMSFPIDIIWIGQNLKIVHIEKSLTPETYPEIFRPEANSLYVLEISAGQADSLRLEIGDAVKFLEK